MTHLELENLITDYLDGGLEADRAATVTAHLASCSACRETVEDVRFAIARCRAAQELEPAPWLVSRILHASTGQRKPNLTAQIAGWLRPVLRPQVIYGVSMAVFSLSFILFVAKANLRSLNVRELNPALWVERANSRGHLLIARAEKFYYDIRFVYEVQSVLRELRQEPSPRPAKPGGRNGGTSRARPLDQERLALRGHRPAFRDVPSLQGSRLTRVSRSLPT
ncbi:MAG TPA: zf-HC2 domain-containing protein [Terriglobia bacterium]|nr:zf-HC2 domain-containing protein [Terriglobia bacterium]